MYSRKASSRTSPSLMINATLCPFTPASLNSPFISSRKLAGPYALEGAIWKGTAPATAAASLASDCFPLPPTPTSTAELRSIARTREALARCESASSKSTSGVAAPRAEET